MDNNQAVPARSLLQCARRLISWSESIRPAAGKGVSSAAWLFLLLVVAASPLPGQTNEDFFNPGILHQIELVIEPGDWATLKAQYMQNTRYPCELRWRYQGRDVVVEKVTVHSRGTGARSPVKPQLGVDFDHTDKNKTFLGLKSFILRNNTQDASMMHERLALLLFRRMGLPAPRCAHTRLSVNGAYAGLYMIVEAIDSAFLDRVFGEHKGYLYKDNVADPDYYYLEYRGPDPQAYVPNPFESQNHASDPNDNPLVDMIYQINFASDANFLSAVDRYLDVRLFITQVAVDRFLTEDDGIAGNYGTNNFYLYRFEGTSRHQFITWDKSNSFISWPNETIWRFLEDVPPDRRNRLMVRAMKIPELREIYLRGLARAADTAGGENGLLARDIEQIYEQIRASAREDPYKQCYIEGRITNCPNEVFEVSVQLLRDFARNRCRFVLDEVMRNLALSSQYELSVAVRKGDSVSTLGNMSSPASGYVRVDGRPGISGLSGISIFRLQRNGIVVSEAVIPPSSPIKSGRFSVAIAPTINTAAAIVNPGDQPAILSFYYTDLEGHTFGKGTTEIPAGAQVAEFLDQPRFGSVARAHGTFTFHATVPVAVAVFRTLVNERCDFLVTPLPVFDLSSSTSDAAIFAHFADGGGWTTTVTLINGSEETVRGTLVFMDSGSSTMPARPMAVSTASELGSTFEYVIPPGSAWELPTSGLGSSPSTGTIWIVPAPASRTPKGWARFAQTQNGVVVSETSLCASVAAQVFRIYAELSGESVNTALALANPAAEAVAVEFQMMTLLGTDTGLKGELTVPARGSAALYLRQIPGFEHLDETVNGVLRLAASAPSGILADGFIFRRNMQGDWLAAAVPAFDERAGSPPAGLIFPYLVDDVCLKTRYVVFPVIAGPISPATLRFLTQGGGPLNLLFW